MSGFTRLIPLFFCALVLAACGSGGGSKVSEKNLSKLVLGTSDLPKVFKVFTEGAPAAIDTQGTPRADLARFGRKGGWVVRFHRPGSAATRGPLVVTSSVDVFGDSGGAKKDFGAYRAQYARQAGARIVDVPKLGDEAIVVSIIQAGAKPVIFFTVAWRDRNATASVAANGFGGNLTLRDVMALARRQERRLAGA